MKQVFGTTLLFSFLLIMGCGGNTNPQSPGAHDAEEGSGNLRLNHGAKWQANPETTRGIENMQALVKEYLEGSGKDIQKLRGDLEKEFSLILHRCTMKGEAHEQLHQFLLPLKAKIGKLGEGSEQEVRDIGSYLTTYFTYFQ